LNKLFFEINDKIFFFEKKGFRWNRIVEATEKNSDFFLKLTELNSLKAYKKSGRAFGVSLSLIFLKFSSDFLTSQTKIQITKKFQIQTWAFHDNVLIFSGLALIYEN